MDKLATEEYPDISYALDRVAQCVYPETFLPSKRVGKSWTMEVKGYDHQVFFFDPTADQCEGMPSEHGVLPSVWTKAMVQEFLVCITHALGVHQRLMARRAKQIFAFQIEQAMPKSLVVTGQGSYRTV